MKAILCKAYGPPGSLVVEDVPSPTVGPGDVLVSVTAASVNFMQRDPARYTAGVNRLCRRAYTDGDAPHGGQDRADQEPVPCSPRGHEEHEGFLIDDRSVST
jgi:hypothetical protein